MTQHPNPCSSSSPDILVLGGTGLVGRHVLAALRRRGAAARVLVRDPARLADSDGLDVHVGDLRDPQALRAAVDGVRAVFYISPHEPDEVELARCVVRACEDSGARLVFAGVHAHSGLPLVGSLVGSLLRFAYGRVLPSYRGKLALAHAIARSRTEPVVLVPTNFMQMDEVLLDEIRAGRFVHPTHPRGLNRVDLRDLGDAAARVLTDPGFPSGSYDVVGPRSVTATECAEVWSRALGRPVAYVDDPDVLDAALARVATGQRLEDFRASLRAIRRLRVGTSRRSVATTAWLLGRPPAEYADVVTRIAAAGTTPVPE